MFYSTFDTARPNLAGLYQDQSMLTFEGQKFQGTQAVSALGAWELAGRRAARPDRGSRPRRAAGRLPATAAGGGGGWRAAAVAGDGAALLACWVLGCHQLCQLAAVLCGRHATHRHAQHHRTGC